MKRKHVLFSCLIITLLCNFSSAGQDVAPFQLEEEHILELDESVLDGLIDKSWYCTMRKYVEREVWYNNKSAWGYLKLEKEGIALHNNHEGTWFIDDDKILYLDFESDDYNKYKVWFAGGYVILKANEDELIIRKSLTSSFDNDFTYFFESEKRLKARIAAQKAEWKERKKHNPQKERKPFSQMSRQELVQELYAELFIRKVKLEVDPSELSKFELLKELEKIQKGK